MVQAGTGALTLTQQAKLQPLTVGGRNTPFLKRTSTPKMCSGLGNTRKSISHDIIDTFFVMDFQVKILH